VDTVYVSLHLFRWYAARRFRRCSQLQLRLHCSCSKKLTCSLLVKTHTKFLGAAANHNAWNRKMGVVFSFNYLSIF